MAEWKASFWQEEYDVYTDTEIWRHKDTGEVRTVRPKVEDFIPEGYEMPTPPSKRLEDMSDSSSSGSSSASGSAGKETAGRPRRRGRALDGGSSGSSSPSTSSGWSFTSSSSDEGLEESNDEGEMPSEATGGSGSSSSSSSTAPASSRLGETAAAPASFSSTGSADGRSSGSSSHSKSGSVTSSSSADASGASSETRDGEDSAGTSEESSRAPTPPLLGLSDGRENGTTSSESRSTAKRTSTDGQTASTTLVTDADSAEAVALQITSGGALETEGERKELAIVTAGEKNVHSSGTEASSSRGSTAFVKGGRRGSTSGGKGRRRKSRPISKGLTVFIKDKTAEAYQKMEKLIQASEDDSSSHPSSLRTEKSLQRQREWEIDHARVRARQLREERLQEYQQEAKIRREMAAVEAGSLSSSEPPQQSLDEVMESVGWDPDGTYTNKEVEAFAEKAMATLKDIGRDANVELSKFGNTAF